MIGFRELIKNLLKKTDYLSKIRSRKFIAFLIISFLILMMGFGYYLFESARIKKAKLREIAAIGELKVKELYHWRNERLTDARSMAQSLFFRRAVFNWLLNPSDTNLKNELIERLDLEKNEKTIDDIFLIDTLEQIILSTGDTKEKVSYSAKKAIAVSKMNRNAVFSDLYYSSDSVIYLDVVAPLIAADQKIISFILLHQRASAFLYPLIESWPIPSESSETVLSQQEGDSVVFLNNLKFISNSALKLKLPLTRTDVPTVQAVLGKTGNFDGKDYRGVDVLANLTAVPGSPWFIVCKVDKSEGMEELRYRVIVIVLFISILIVCVMFLFYLTRKQKESDIYKKMFHKEQEANFIISVNEEKFRTLFENITEGVAIHEMVYDEKGNPVDYRIIDVNPAYFSHTGVAREMARGKLATELYQMSTPPYLDEYYEVSKTRKPYRFETYFPPMQKHFMISVISPRVGQFATVFEDITERKNTEDELRKKNEELARFIYTVSHDLKSPLVTIKSFSSYLKEDIENNDKEAISKDMGYIQNAADKMGLLLDELLELSRIGRKGNPKKEIAFQEIVGSAVDLVAGRISERKVNVTISDQPVILYGDPQRLIQLYQNLIDNSVKFMGDQPNPLIEIGAETRNNEILLFVRDNGSGIDSRYSHKLFGLFEKLDTESDGTGIGLALVKRIVETHKGSVWYESAGPGKGTTFYFKLGNTRIETSNNSKYG